MRALSRRFGVAPSLLVLAFLAATLHTGPAAASPRRDPYSDPSRWVCRPDRDDVCDGGLDATVVKANGSTSIERWRPAGRPPVDCFYVYPTVSWDLAPNSDLSPGPLEELAATQMQAARLGSTCRVFAPLYRQVTLTWLTLASLDPAQLSLFPPELVAVAYADVVAAFRHYLAFDNRGRGFVLVGHSQGAGLLARLLDEEIAPSPALRSHLVSAALIGLLPTDRPGEDEAPACTDADQLGCLVTFSSFRASRPPTPDSIFSQPGERNVCTNPAGLGGGRATLHPYFATGAYPWTVRPVRTPYVSVPGLVDGTCATTAGGVDYLAIDVNANPRDPRTDDIPGDTLPGLGLHLVDMQLIQGDLVDLVGRQASAYRRAHR